MRHFKISQKKPGGTYVYISYVYNGTSIGHITYAVGETYVSFDLKQAWATAYR